jgi:hypothetical protein
MKRALTALLVLMSPATCPGVTAPDLSTRIRIDGRAVEYTDDEWILDAATVFSESDHDSRWGADNDVWRIATTWDETYLYIAIEGVFRSSALMAFLEHAGSGVTDLISAGPIRRNIEFYSIVPNAVIEADRASLDATVAAVSIVEPPQYLSSDAYQSRFFQPTQGPGTLEIALPWSAVFPVAGYVRLLACVTGGVGTGVGDAAPDPTQLLSANYQAQAYLDNSITVPVDDNHDGLPDTGVMPRSVVEFAFDQTAPVGHALDIDLRLEKGSFAPDASEVLRFQIGTTAAGGPIRLYISCEVFSVSGERVRVLFRDQPRELQEGVEPQWDVWDGRNDAGDIVRGGIYVVLATSGPSPGVASRSAKQSVAVVR